MTSRLRRVVLALLAASTALAWQTYSPPPPPKLPSQLSKSAVETGRALFETNTLRDGPLDVHNYLGSRPCAACHDRPTPLKPDELARKFGEIRSIINREISTRAQGKELPPQDPAMEALVQYLIDRYGLKDFKLLE
jgi:hypothetical protein